MTSIQVDEQTAQTLAIAAARLGMSLSDYVRTLVETSTVATQEPSSKSQPDFKAYLMSMPDVGDDVDFSRTQDSMRQADFSE